jgi:hypothetical protein
VNSNVTIVDPYYDVVVPFGVAFEWMSFDRLACARQFGSLDSKLRPTSKTESMFYVQLLLALNPQADIRLRL